MCVSAYVLRDFIRDPATRFIHYTYKRLTSRRDFVIIIIQSSNSLLDFMNDYDASSVWDYEISCHDSYENHTCNMQDTYELDEEYARDSCDYTQLAYMHYA